MINCVNINLCVNPLREGLDINSFGKNSHIKIPLSDINNDLISIFENLNLTLIFAELFYTHPFSFTKIHVDLLGGDYTKLNYVYGGENSNMCWYKQKNEIQKSPSITVIDSSYISFNLNEVYLIDTQPIKFPSIVQAGIPHNVRNSNNPRYCLSLVLVKQDNTRLTMAESIEIFNSYI